MNSLRIERRIKSDFAQVLSGNMLYYACQWSIVVALAKLGTPAQLGEYALGMAIAAPILLFANLQVRVLIASDVKNEFTFDQFFTFRVASLLLASLAIAGVAMLSRTSGQAYLVVMAVGLAQAIDCFADTYYGWMQKHERLDRMARSLAMKGPLALGLLILTMLVTHSVLWAVLGLAVGRLAILFAWDRRLGFTRMSSAVRFEWSFLRLRSRRDPLAVLLRLAVPLGVISMLGSLSANIPRYFVEAHLGTAELGIFSAIASLLSAGTLVVSALGQSAFVPVARAHARADRPAFRTYFALATGAGLVLGCAGIAIAALFGRPILAHLFRPEYAARQDVLVRLMIAGTIIFAGNGAGAVITAARRLDPQVPVLALGAVACMAVSAWLIPRIGLDGAADAILAAAIVQLAGTAVIAWKIDRRLGAPLPAASELAEIEAV